METADHTGTDATATNDTPSADRDAERLARWEDRTGTIIVVAAIVPIAGAILGPGKAEPLPLIDFASWLVFLVDFVVHLRLRRRYLSTWAGRFDAAIVLLTFPWYVFPPFDGTAFLGILRLGRIARLLLASESRRKWLRIFTDHGLDRTILIVGMITLVCAVIVYFSEPPTSGFENMGDALWWAVVTLTTVGYGDLTPVTGIGRFTAFVLMLTGLAFLGTVSGTLAAFFRSSESEESADKAEETLDALREEVATLNRRLGSALAHLDGDDEPERDPRH